MLANKLNFEEKVYSLEQTLHSWKRRNLPLIGRINIVKTLGLAKLVYSTSLLTISKPLIDTINKIIFRFIWEGKALKIKRKTIIAEKKCGGPKMIDSEIMERVLKIAWIKRIAEGGDASGKTILNYAAHNFVQCPFTIYYGLINAIPKTWKPSPQYCCPRHQVSPGYQNNISPQS